MLGLWFLTININLFKYIIIHIKFKYIYTSAALHAISALGKICTPSAINSNPSLTDYEVYFLKSSTANIKSLREVVVSPTQAAKSSALIPLALANPNFIL